MMSERWEYMTVSADDRYETVELELYDLGARGWEVVAAQFGPCCPTARRPYGVTQALLKRRLQEVTDE